MLYLRYILRMKLDAVKVRGIILMGSRNMREQIMHFSRRSSLQMG